MDKYDELVNSIQILVQESRKRMLADAAKIASLEETIANLSRPSGLLKASVDDMIAQLQSVDVV